MDKQYDPNFFPELSYNCGAMAGGEKVPGEGGFHSCTELVPQALALYATAPGGFTSPFVIEWPNMGKSGVRLYISFTQSLYNAIKAEVFQGHEFK